MLSEEARQRWVLLTYKIPREPTAPRVSVWRRLKRMGALLLHDTVWVLPATPQTREQFQWLVTEIQEGGHEVMLWEAELPLPGQSAALKQLFLAQVDREYDAILRDLELGDADLASLARRFQQLQDQDHLHSARALAVRQALLRASQEPDRR
jgi:ChrB-like protein